MAYILPIEFFTAVEDAATLPDEAFTHSVDRQVGYDLMNAHTQQHVARAVRTTRSYKSGEPLPVDVFMRHNFG